MCKLKGLSTIWIILLTAGITLVVLGTIALVWYSISNLKKAENINSNRTSTQKTTTTETPSTKTPSEEPTQVVEGFDKSIFDSLSGSSINLTKAKNYLISDLQAKVNDTKESYWDIHNSYIAAGPCRISVEQIDKTETTATVQMSAEWGLPNSCNILEMSPAYKYILTNINGEWKISSILPNNPDQPGQENIPRGF